MTGEAAPAAVKLLAASQSRGSFCLDKGSRAPGQYVANCEKAAGVAGVQEVMFRYRVQGTAAVAPNALNGRQSARTHEGHPWGCPSIGKRSSASSFRFLKSFYLLKPMCLFSLVEALSCAPHPQCWEKLSISCQSCSTGWRKLVHLQQNLCTWHEGFVANHAGATDKHVEHPAKA